VLLLPAAIVAIVVAHILLVRKHGVVPPFEVRDPRAKPSRPTSTVGQDQPQSRP
jgi:quinol-cytochrome oxidoreductase complex cytochrome b subunit